MSTTTSNWAYKYIQPLPQNRISNAESDYDGKSLDVHVPCLNIRWCTIIHHIHVDWAPIVVVVRMSAPIIQIFNDESIAIRMIFLDLHMWNKQ